MAPLGDAAEARGLPGDLDTSVHRFYVDDLKVGVARPVGGEDHKVRVGAARGGQQQPVALKLVCGTTELTARNHVIGRELGCDDAEVL